jgi:hypothetical protein
VNLRRYKHLALGIIILSSQILFIGTDPAKAVNDVSSSCAVGSSSSCPAQSPQEIVNLYGTTTNGSYWLNVNGTATETYLILNSGYPEGGSWFLGMKGTKTSTSFTYSAGYWTDATTTLSPSSLSDDVSTDAKFNAFNYLPVTRIAAVFEDRSSQAFNASGSGDYGTNSFAGHTWTEAISSQTMLNRFNSNSNVAAGSGTWTSYSKYRETNSASGKLVFPYQTGYVQYGYANTNGQSYRWGVTFNNESSQGSNDSVSGIGLASYSAAGVLSYSDSLSYTVNGGTGSLNGGTQTLQSGFQIWGKMASGTLAAPGSLTQSQQSSSSSRISWGSVASATEYVVQYKTSAQSWSQGSTVRVSSPSASPSALLTGLTDSSYNLRIWARGANNTYGSASGSITMTLDQSAPTLTSSSSFNFAENTSTSSTAALISVNESSTITVNSGSDSAIFALSTVDTLTARIRFLSSPDFENALDVGANNVYNISLRATDSLGNFADLAISITVTNVNESSNLGAPTVSGTIYKGISTTISVTVGTAGKVRFFVGNKRIANCLARSTTGSYPNFSATCSWKPSVSGRATLTARVTPSDNSFSAATSEATSILVLRRTNQR